MLSQSVRLLFRLQATKQPPSLPPPQWMPSAGLLLLRHCDVGERDTELATSPAAVGVSQPSSIRGQ